MLQQLDLAVLFALNHLGPEGLAREAVIRAVATGLMYVLAAVVVYLAWRKPDGRQVLLCALGSALLAFLLGKTLNQLVDRDRPFVLYPDQVRHIALIVRPDSFPSIHAITAFGLLGGVLFGRYPRWGLLMLGLGLPMIAARVAAGVHWPTDVLGGAALGLLMAGLFMTVQRRYLPGLGLARTATAQEESPVPEGK